MTGETTPAIAARRTAIAGSVWAALGGVRDPELDEAVTELGFVAEATVRDDGEVVVRLRLPTYFCAPNFAYLMVADAHDAVAAVPGVRRVDVRLLDHFAADEINAGVAEGAGFRSAFPGLADDELAELRTTFQRKAHTAAVERACRTLVAAGRPIEALGDARLADLPPAERDRVARRRTAIGLSADPADPLLVDDRGRPVPAERAEAHLRFAKAVRVSIDGNSGFCRGLLHTRYPDSTDLEAPAGEDGSHEGSPTRPL